MSGGVFLQHVAMQKGCGCSVHGLQGPCSKSHFPPLSSCFVGNRVAPALAMLYQRESLFEGLLFFVVRFFSDRKPNFGELFSTVEFFGFNRPNGFLFVCFAQVFHQGASGQSGHTCKSNRVSCMRLILGCRNIMNTKCF